jgi:hypothetical protein
VPLVVVTQLQSEQFWIWAGVINVIVDGGLDSQGIMLQYLERGRHFSFLQDIWGPPSILLSGYNELFIGRGRGGGGSTHVPSTKVESEWSHIISISTYSFMACIRRALPLSVLNLSPNGDEWFWNAVAAICGRAMLFGAWDE